MIGAPAGERAAQDGERPPDVEGRPSGLTPVARSGTLWAVWLAVALVEIVGLGVIASRIPEDRDWDSAGAWLRARLGPADAVAVAPDWIDPHVRRVAGDAMTLRSSGRSDLAPFERLFVVSARGELPLETPRRDPDEVAAFGRLRVMRWDLGPSPVRFDFVQQIRRARVTWRQQGRERPCSWRAMGVGLGGGLGTGPATPAERFVCEGAPPWIWVGATVLEDLDLRPRYCVWQHPTGPEPVRVRYDAVPVGERLVLYAGLYYEDERMLAHGPFTVRVLLDGREIGRLEHRDGEGWKRAEMMTRSLERAVADPDARGSFVFEVTAPDPHLRRVCWAATVRVGRDRASDAPLPPPARPTFLRRVS
ncbi:MAG: hypothetical protein RMK74_04280 [Myxococcales bacterium]|nr:hypothetical protein [Myxococcales bacterium]